MKNNKSKKIFIISIIVLVVVLTAGIAYAMIATDLFKSEKNLFFKYASQIFEEENAFIDTRIEQYIEKMGSSATENAGTISFGQDSDSLASVISFEGNTDSNNNIEEEISINFSDDVNLPILYKKINNQHGIKISEISKRYFTINIKNFMDIINKSVGESDTLVSQTKDASKSLALSEDTENNNEDTMNLLLTDEEKKKFIDNYLKPLEEKLDNSMFTKVSTVESKGYSLSISNQKFSELMVQFLEILKNDEQMINKLNNLIPNISTKEIEQVIDNINSAEIPEGTIIMTVYQADGKLNKIDIQINDILKLSISKIASSNDVTYKIDMENQENSINAELSYTGLQNIEEVQEEHTLTVNGETSAIINIQNTVKFLDEEEKIANYDKKNTVKLEELDSEKLNKVTNAFMSNLLELIGQKMEAAGLIPDASLFNQMIFMGQLPEISYNGESSSTTDEENSSSQNTSSGGLVDDITKTEKESFNAKFKAYEGDDIKGSIVKQLIMQIIANNMLEDGRKIELTGDVTLTGDSVPDTIKTSKKYKVECLISSSSGFVNEIKITENN